MIYTIKSSDLAVKPESDGNLYVMIDIDTNEMKHLLDQIASKYGAQYVADYVSKSEG